MLIDHAVKAAYSSSQKLPHFSCAGIHAEVHSIRYLQLLCHPLLCMHPQWPETLNVEHVKAWQHWQHTVSTSKAEWLSCEVRLV